MVVFLRRKSVLLTPFSDARCSKRPDFSPAQPWRAETRLFPNKAAAIYHLLRGGWDGPNCAQYSTHPALSAPRRALSRARAFQFPIPLFREWPRLPSTARIERYTCSLQACSFFLQGWGLIDLLLRASNEGLLRPRVARAQKIIRLHPLLYSASKEGTWPLPAHPSEAARCASTGIVPATPLSFSASC
jgi:hypothetical protein